MTNPNLFRLPANPFDRLRALLSGPGGGESLPMSIGEPQHPAPAFVAEILAREAAGWSKYPPLTGTPAFRAAAAAWAERRYRLPAGALDPETALLPVAGTREALGQITIVAAAPATPPALVLLPSPGYQVYGGAAIVAGAEGYYVPAHAENGFLPDYKALPESVLSRASVAYLCSPANPQGAVATKAQLADAIRLARRHGFILAVDECYAEIYDRVPPPGALEVCAELPLPASGDMFENVVVFHSLSKRSSVPGLRSGFIAGGRAIIEGFTRLRACGGAAMPLPVLAAATALWQDEEHVEANRALYRAKFDLAERILGNRLNFVRPAGGFFLWLDVGDGERAAKALWDKTGIRVLPGAYLASPGSDSAAATPYVRIALVHDLATTERALTRIAETLKDG